MGWMDKSWSKRAAVSVDNTSGAASIDIEIALSASWSEFWDFVQDDGDDIRITAGDGETLLSFALDSWNYSNKAGTIQVDAYAGLPNAAQDATVQVFVYWGNDAAAAGTTSVTILNPKTGTVYRAKPGSGSYPVIKCRPPVLDRDETTHTVTKQTTETIRIWWDLRDMLATTRYPNQGSSVLEEIDYFTFNVVTGIDGDPAAALFDETKNYTAAPHFVSTLVKAGGDDSNYLMTLKVYTTEGRILDLRATLKVNDLAANLVTV